MGDNSRDGERAAAPGNDRAGGADPFIRGMDLSTLLEVEHCGGRFYDHGAADGAMDILKRYGMNMVRLRLWNDPFDEHGNSYGAGGNDIETTLTLAKRAKSKGIGWLLDFHYSDFWADPGKQTVPKAWRGLGAEELARAVYDYTREVLERCRREDVLPQMAAIGNEVTNGLLWPHGKTPDFPGMVRLLNAGLAAVREAAPETRTMLHLDNGGNNALYRSWFEQYFACGGDDFDCIGLSYYPFWHGTPDMLRANMNDLAARFRKELIVAEISTGHTMEDYAAYEQLAPEDRKGMASRRELAERVPYPMTEQGQADFMRDIIRIIRETPDSLGRGFYYWEPAWIPVPGSGWATKAACEYIGESGPGGNEWANQALFDYDGNALPALAVIRDA